jgi:hypothetical protein
VSAGISNATQTFIHNVTKMEISRPRRILAVSRPDSGLLDLLKGDTTSKYIHQLLTRDAGLTGEVPSITGDSIAGTTHEWNLKTNYYTANIPIWLDEISDPEVWSAEFLTPEAREVLTVIGAFVVCFCKPVDAAELNEVKDLLENVAEVVKEGCGYSWDGVCLAVAMPQSKTPYLDKSFDEWGDLCQDFGFEFIDFEAKGRNEYSGKLCMRRSIRRMSNSDTFARVYGLGEVERSARNQRVGWG